MRPPTMFQRRLLLIAGAIAVGYALLAAQLYRVTLIQGDRWLASAESALVAERWMPTVRGRILDRKGRVLAADRPAFNVLADYPAINGELAFIKAEESARDLAGDGWSALGPREREVLIRQELPIAERELEIVWDELAAILGVDAESLLATRMETIQRVQRMGSYVWSRRLAAARAEYEAKGSRGPAPTLDEVNQPLTEQEDPHVVAQGIDESRAHAVRRLADRFPWLSVEPSGERDYPFETVEVVVDRRDFPTPLKNEGGEFVSVTATGVATHILGWLTDAKAEHVQARPVRRAEGGADPGGYFPGDPVGAAGLEEGYEDLLRGERGRRVWRKDTGAQTITEPTAGQDLHLTIDIMLQARIQALFDPSLGLAVVQDWQGQPKPEYQPVGTPLAGAAVVLDVQSGEVLALVSAPSFTREQMLDDPAWVFQNPELQPIANRAIGKPYPPGSIVKPAILASAVTEGVHSLNHHIPCTGHLLPNHKDKYRCWLYRDKYGLTTHTSDAPDGLSGEEAIAGSCNIYFYTLGRAMGGVRIAKWYEKFGVTRGFGFNIGSEFAGWLGRRAENGGAMPIELNEATLMGMGQGPVAWTPLHAADCYATLARQGVRMTPRLIRTQKPEVDDLRLNLPACDAALEGLRRVMSAEHRGTGSTVDWGTGVREPLVAMEGLTIRGKTGTAEAPDVRVALEPGEEPPAKPEGAPEGEPDAEGNADADAEHEARARFKTVRSGDHSWFVMLVGREGEPPRYAVAVVVDYGGSGGRVGGPIANQVLRALRDEGYL